MRLWGPGPRGADTWGDDVLRCFLRVRHDDSFLFVGSGTGPGAVRAFLGPCGRYGDEAELRDGRPVDRQIWTVAGPQGSRAALRLKVIATDS